MKALQVLDVIWNFQLIIIHKKNKIKQNVLILKIDRCFF